MKESMLESQAQGAGHLTHRCCLFLFVVLCGVFVASPARATLSFTTFETDLQEVRGAGSQVQISLRICRKAASSKHVRRRHKKIALLLAYGHQRKLRGLRPIHRKKLRWGASHDCIDYRRKVTMPANVLPGQRYLYARIKSGRTWLRAYKTIRVMGKAHIQVEALESSRQAQQAGGKLTLFYRIRNTGFVRMSRPATVVFYVASSPGAKARERKLYRVRVPRLNAKARYPRRGRGKKRLVVTLPLRAKGQLYIGSFVAYPLPNTISTKTPHLRHQARQRRLAQRRHNK